MHYVAIPCNSSDRADFNEILKELSISICGAILLALTLIALTIASLEDRPRRLLIVFQATFGLLFYLAILLQWYVDLACRKATLTWMFLNGLLSSQLESNFVTKALYVYSYICHI